MAQHPYLDMTVVVRTGAPIAGLLPAIRAALRAYDPALMMYNADALDASVSRSNAFRRSMLVIVAAFAGAAMVLLAIGVYGVVSNVAARRFGEMGIRMALGAQRRDVVWSVLRSNLVLIAVGLVAGAAIAIAAAPVLGRVLFEVSATDFGIYFASATALALVALFASYVPAYRMGRVAPLQALRHE